jgi:hypothetical protein
LLRSPDGDTQNATATLRPPLFGVGDSETGPGRQLQNMPWVSIRKAHAIANWLETWIF